MINGQTDKCINKTNECMNKDSVVLAKEQPCRPMEQNGENINKPHTYSHLTFYEGAKAIQGRKNSLLMYGAGITECPCVQRKKWT